MPDFHLSEPTKRQTVGMLRFCRVVDLSHVTSFRKPARKVTADAHNFTDVTYRKMSSVNHACQGILRLNSHSEQF